MRKEVGPNETVSIASLLAALILCAVNINVLAAVQSNAMVTSQADAEPSYFRDGRTDIFPGMEVYTANVMVTGSLKRQTITFEPLQARTVGDPEFLLNASASSGLPVSFSSSNPQVAVVEGNTVKIMGGGTAFLSASQSGNDMFHAAPMVIRLLTVNKLSQTIVFEDLPEELDIRTSPFLLNGTASSGLPVTFASSNVSVIRIEGNRCTVVGAGTASISCVQFGNSNYDPALPVRHTVSVKKDIGDAKPAEDITVLSKPVGEWMFIGMNEFRDGEPVSVEIIDSRKKSVIRMTTKEQEQLSVNVAGMSPGIYYLKLSQDERKITTRFVKL